jgi:predicted CopG family antitoxin
MYEYMYIDDSMPSKNISITEDIYNELVKLKNGNESFSDIISRLVMERKKDPLKFFGILEDIPDEIMDDFEKGMDDLKKTATLKAKEKIEQEW